MVYGVSVTVTVMRGCARGVWKGPGYLPALRALPLLWAGPPGSRRERRQLVCGFKLRLCVLSHRLSCGVRASLLGGVRLG